MIYKYIDEKTQFGYESAVSLLEILKEHDEDEFKNLLEEIKKNHFRKRNLMSLISKKGR
ncbi:hypothetical protein ACPB8Q_06645 [Methanocaldococcus indicus]|uniref:hypothetical protein n=1 Tax=Methanocaldococcus indicus TaxID=213231 RepID=UPI003C6D6B4A